MVRVLGKKAKDQLVLLFVAVHVPPSSVDTLDLETLSEHDQRTLLEEGLNAVPAHQVAVSLVATLCHALAQQGGVRYAVDDRDAHQRRSTVAQGTHMPYLEVYDAIWLPTHVPACAVEDAAAEAAHLNSRQHLKRAKLETASHDTQAASASALPTPRRARGESQVCDSYSPISGGTRATADVLRWTRQLRVRLMWRPPAGRGMATENLFRTACATLSQLPVSLTAADLASASRESGTGRGDRKATNAPQQDRRRHRREEVSMSMRIALRVQYP